jgi:YidC/Oxa1 family membrane protein insertase
MLRSSLRHDICPEKNPLHAAHTVPCGPHGGASFLFIPDLTNKATGAVLVVLIILYVGTQLGSSLLMSAPTMDKTQRQLMMAMPLFFVIFIISFPAGVIVYWITTNAWTIGQQYFIRRRVGPVTPVPATADGGGGGGGGGSPPARGGGGGGTTKRPEPSTSDGNGSGGLASVLRGRTKTEEPAAVSSSQRPRRSAPPPSPRKKKKRSGRRR